MRENLESGVAANTAAAQAWLNSCPAVIDWTEDGETISFRYDPTIEVLAVPHVVTFQPEPARRSEIARMGGSQNQNVAR